jgi:membrane-associated phospholipid phosphatase
MYTAYYGFTAWALSRGKDRARLAAFLPLVLVATIGPARVRDGKHRASDVIAGYVVGGLYLIGLIALAEGVAAGADQPRDPKAREAARGKPEASGNSQSQRV